MTRDIRSRRLNTFLRLMRRPVRYLEIGVSTAETLVAIDAEVRIGVDPFPKFKQQDLPPDIEFWSSTSDEFFRKTPHNLNLSLCFVDGLHEWKQTYKDILNAFNHLGPGGVVVVDDCLPRDWHSAQPDESVASAARADGTISHGGWYGDVWKCLFAIRNQNPELAYVTVGARFSGTHGQAFLWRRMAQSAPYKSPDFQSPSLVTLDGLDFRDVFPGRGVPRVLNPRRETARLTETIIRSAK